MILNIYKDEDINFSNRKFIYLEGRTPFIIKNDPDLNFDGNNEIDTAVVLDFDEDIRYIYVDPTSDSTFAGSQWFVMARIFNYKMEGKPASWRYTLKRDIVSEYDFTNDPAFVERGTPIDTLRFQTDQLPVNKIKKSDETWNPGGPYLGVFVNPMSYDETNGAYDQSWIFTAGAKELPDNIQTGLNGPNENVAPASGDYYEFKGIEVEFYMNVRGARPAPGLDTTRWTKFTIGNETSNIASIRSLSMNNLVTKNTNCGIFEGDIGTEFKPSELNSKPSFTFEHVNAIFGVTPWDGEWGKFASTFITVPKAVVEAAAYTSDVNNYNLQEFFKPTEYGVPGGPRVGQVKYDDTLYIVREVNQYDNYFEDDLTDPINTSWFYKFLNTQGYQADAAIQGYRSARQVFDQMTYIKSIKTKWRVHTYENKEIEYPAAKAQLVVPTQAPFFQGTPYKLALMEWNDDNLAACHELLLNEPNERIVDVQQILFSPCYGSYGEMDPTNSPDFSTSGLSISGTDPSAIIPVTFIENPNIKFRAPIGPYDAGNKEYDSLSFFSPNRKSNLDVTPYFNNGISMMEVDFKLRPFQSIYYCQPWYDVNGLYGGNYGDKRSLIIQEDLSLQNYTGPWVQSFYQNETINNQFNRGLQTLDLQQKYEREADVLGRQRAPNEAKTLAAQDVQTRWGMGNTLLLNLPAAIGQTQGQGGDVARNYEQAAELDFAMNAAIRNDTRSASIDMFNFSKQNITSQAPVMTKPDVFDGKYRPGVIVEKWSTSDREKELVDEYKQRNGEPVNAHATFGEYWQTGKFIKGFLNKSKLNTALHNEINQRLKDGVYV